MRQHGTYACYVWGPEPGCLPGRGCRCTECSLAVGRRRDERRRNPTEYVDANAVRAHISALSEAGVGYKQVAKVSGVSNGAMWKIVFGNNGQLTKRTLATTAEKILSVTPEDLAGGALIDAGPTWVIVGKLQEAGWSKAAIARAIGNDRALQIGKHKVEVATADKIAALLFEPEPPPVTPEERVRAADRVMMPLIELLEARVEQNWWRSQAACAGEADPSIFMPGRGESTADAREFCRRCPVQSECLEANLYVRVGVYGGLSERQRRVLRRERADQAGQEAA